MAAVDSLLKIVTGQKKAFGLRLGPDEIPELLTTEGNRPLSMPPLAESMVELFVGEVLSRAEREELDSKGATQATHEVAGAGVFRITVEKKEGKLVTTFRQAGDRAPAKGAPARAAPEPMPEREAQPAGPPATPGGPPLEPDSQTGPAGPTSPFGSTSLTSPTSPNEEAPPRLELDAPGGAMEGWLRHSAEIGASDIILAEHDLPRMRIDGRLDTIADHTLTRADIEGFLSRALDPARRETFDRHGSVDLSIELGPLGGERPTRFRVNLFRHIDGLAAALRPISTNVPDLEQLGLPRRLANLVHLPHGLVLFTGPTGTGKSTTLAALLAHLNRTAPRHIVTIEDPIELRYPPGRCIIHQRELGSHVSSFAQGLRAALRQSPDVILVGEMRDPETMAAALTAAETGHLVLSTLHCGTADMAIDRIVDSFDEFRHAQVRLQLAGVLRTVISQRLLPRAAGGGFVPAVEVLNVTPAISNLIREGRTHQIRSYLQSGRGEGMISMDQCLARLVRAKKIGRQVALDSSPDPTHLAELLRS
jgi:twitching motility protein PilT